MWNGKDMLLKTCKILWKHQTLLFFPWSKFGINSVIQNWYINKNVSFVVNVELILNIEVTLYCRRNMLRVQGAMRESYTIESDQKKVGQKAFIQFIFIDLFIPIIQLWLYVFPWQFLFWCTAKMQCVGEAGILTEDIWTVSDTDNRLDYRNLFVCMTAVLSIMASQKSLCYL